MTDFREIETLLCRFFASRGAMPSCASGDAYIGWASTRVSTTAPNPAGHKGSILLQTEVVVEDEPSTKVICLTDLAHELSAAGERGGA